MIGTDGFQETPIVEVTRQITKHNYLVMDVNDIPRVLKEVCTISLRLAQLHCVAYAHACASQPAPLQLGGVGHACFLSACMVQPLLPPHATQAAFNPTRPMQQHGHTAALPRFSAHNLAASSGP